MEGLSCQSCRGITNEFTILTCDHIVCAECLWGEVTTSLHGLNSLKCSCGVVTTFPKNHHPPQHALNSPQYPTGKLTVATSPRALSARKLKTESGTYSVRAPSSPQRLRESRVPRQQTRSQLQSQLQFLNVQFRKSLQDVQRNYRRVVENLKEKYNNLIRNIRLFWLEEVVESQSMTLLELPRLLMRKYQKAVGMGLQRINQGLMQQLAGMRIETQIGGRIGHSCTHHRHGKENKMMANLDERQRIFQAIQELKEGRSGGGIKKVGRKSKPLFQRV